MGPGEPICMKHAVRRQDIFCVDLKRENSEITTIFYGMVIQRLAFSQSPTMKREQG
jgi:hypothetical protein